MHMFLNVAAAQSTPWPIQLHRRWQRTMLMSDAPCSQTHRRCRRRLSFVSKRLCNNTPRDQALPDVAITQPFDNIQSFSIKADNVPI